MMRGSSDQRFGALFFSRYSRVKFKNGFAIALVGLAAQSCGMGPHLVARGPKLERERVTDNDPNVQGQDWFNLSPEADAKEGESINQVYNLLGSRALAPIIVAVIDSGVDISHQDLQGKIWTNPGETGLDANGNDKATNGIDDDGDGYVDDVHGWNFIGGHDAEGKPTFIDNETLEKTRLLKKFQAAVDAGTTLSDDDQKTFAKVKSEVADERATAQNELDNLNPAVTEIETNYPVVAPLLNNKPVDLVTRDEVARLASTDPAVTSARDKITNAFDGTGFAQLSRMKQFQKIDSDSLEFNLNVDFDPRSTIVGDNPEDFSDTHYGNNAVFGPGADHGTHVSGMIAAVRDNSVGINGVANTAQIMVLRAVPNGDERDKDIALAIRYAADHGARVINMSFGKQYSPHRAEVQAAIEYAEGKGLLLVHAAGNDGKNTTTLVDDNFPTPNRLEGGREKQWVEVGASSADKGPALPAVFSNYGNQSVDIFAPGVKIESTVPGNSYAIFSGTSMASPSFAGAAALVWSVKPELHAAAVRALLLKTGRSYDGLLVDTPTETGPLPQILFSQLSITGKIADAARAVKDLLQL